MNKNLITVLVLAAVAAGVVFLVWRTPKNPSPAQTTPSPKPAAFKVATNPQVGPHLADGNGLTLYLPLGPCWGACLANWVPYMAISGASIKSEDSFLKKINVYPLRDGGYQYGYGERLLYYYRGDKIVGDTNGNGVADGQWTIIKQP